MQDTERPKFEDSWKKAFDGAESTPPDHVWNSIEIDLAGQESAAMKKKLLFYQGLAAAMLLFALTAGVYGYYAQRATGNEQQLADRVSAGSEKTSDKQLIQRENGPVTAADRKAERTEQQGQREHAARKAFDLNEQIALAEELVTPEAIQHSQEAVIKQETLTISEQESKTEAKAEGKTEKEEETSVTDVAAALRQQLEGPEEIVEPKHSKRQKENLWLALGGAAGNYTPNTPTATTPTVSSSTFAAKGPTLDYAAMAAPKPQPKVGSSYSVGVGIGKRFGRLVLQTGINLNKQQINYTSNYDAHSSSNTTLAASSDYIAQNTSLTYTNEYTVSSTMDIVSIPVQLGYMIVDRRLGWQINTGVSNDFFLRNVLVDKSGQRSKFTQEAGSESPYRSVNWSALASTELSYRIGQHYRISLVPGARYSFNSILKNTSDNGRPIVLDVGFRFRYIFD